MTVDSVDITIGGIAFMAFQIGIYFVLRYRVLMLEKKSELSGRENLTVNESVNKKLDAGFKRIDRLSDKLIILEQDSKFHLDLETAEAKFITRKELELHLERIEIVTSSTNDQVKQLMGKQDDILDALSSIANRN